jgi:GNAT superfamily N-acetyltransferase
MSLMLREAVGREDMDRVRRLLADYASEFDAVIRESLARQGFQKELDELPGRYAAPSGALYLATIEGRPAGCVAIRDLGQGDCEMKRLYVAQAFRSRGLGARLIEAAIERGTRLGYRRMALDSTPEMSRAVALYRSFGFEEIAPPVGGDHALYFIRRLTHRE